MTDDEARHWIGVLNERPTYTSGSPIALAIAHAVQSIAERDALKARLRQTAQILIAEIGADGQTNAECAAAEAVQLIRNIRAELVIARSAKP